MTTRPPEATQNVDLDRNQILKKPGRPADVREMLPPNAPQMIFLGGAGGSSCCWGNWHGTKNGTHKRSDHKFSEPSTFHPRPPPHP